MEQDRLCGVLSPGLCIWVLPTDAGKTNTLSANFPPSTLTLSLPWDEVVSTAAWVLWRYTAHWVQHTLQDRDQRQCVSSGCRWCLGLHTDAILLPTQQRALPGASNRALCSCTPAPQGCCACDHMSKGEPCMWPATGDVPVSPSWAQGGGHTLPALTHAAMGRCVCCIRPGAVIILY